MSEVAQLKALFQNARVAFLDLMQKVVNQTNLLSKAYGTDDARFMFFQHFTALNEWLLISLDTSVELTSDNGERVNRYVIMDAETRIHYLLTHDQFNRQAYVTLAMFYLEDFVKSLMRGIQEPPTGTYFAFTRDFLNRLGITNPQKHRIMNAPYQLRNALHNNGYPSRDFDITLNGNHYVFQKGKQLGFTGWNHLHVFFDELFDVLVEVVNNPTIRSVSSIPHSYIVRTD
ncbi:MAG: hypothetical protein JRM71_00950 [Nitrososphaerota archaeon]|nr:hypothetical protein [Nitrososphaerota archaeon]